MIEFVRYSCGLEAGMEAGLSKPTPTAEQIPTGLRRYDSRLDPPAKSRDVSWWAARTAQPRSQWLRLRAWFLDREKPAHEQLALGRDFDRWGLIVAVGRLLKQSDQDMEAGFEIESMRKLHLAEKVADEINRKEQRSKGGKARAEKARRALVDDPAQKYFQAASEQHLMEKGKRPGRVLLWKKAAKLAEAEADPEKRADVLSRITPHQAKKFNERLKPGAQR